MTAKGRSARPTMRDVAARAGVDVSLVSRVLNNREHVGVSALTRERIHAAVRELNYQPNLAARALATARGQMIAFVLPELTSPVYARIVAGAHRRAVAAGYEVVLGELAGVGGDQLRGYALRGVDGVLLAAGTLDDRRVRELGRAGLPIVTVNHHVRGVRHSVIVDYKAGTRLAAEHFVEHGHTSVAVLTGPAVGEGPRRVAMFETAMRELGGAVAAVAHAPDLSAAAGRDVSRNLLQGKEITAVFTTTAMLGVGLIRAAHELGRPVPESLSAIAMHDVDLAEFVVPALTTVAMPMEELGAVAFDHLLAVIRGEDPPATVVPTAPTLVMRESTAKKRSSRR